MKLAVISVMATAGLLSACVNPGLGDQHACVDSEAWLAQHPHPAPMTVETPAEARSALKMGRQGVLTFTGWSGAAIPVFYAAPEAMDARTPVVFAFHGGCRNGHVARDHWRSAAEDYGALMLAPSFSRTDFPRAAGYQLGGVIDPHTGLAREPDQRTFAVIEPLFALLREALGLERETFAMAGHSAGAQFVHRYVMVTPDHNVHAAAIANAGWYTLPHGDVAWPYGIDGAPVDEALVERYLAMPLVLVLGQLDNDPNDPVLRKTPEATAQGPHRLARGRAAFAFARAQAEARGVTFGWRLVEVPGVGHDGSAMAEAALAAMVALAPAGDPAHAQPEPQR